MWQAGTIPPTLAFSKSLTSLLTPPPQGQDNSTPPGAGLFVGYYTGSSPYEKNCLTEDGKLKTGFFESELTLEVIQVRERERPLLTGA